MFAHLRHLTLCSLVAGAMLFAALPSPAQDVAPQTGLTVAAAAVVPHLIKFSGTLPGAPGNGGVFNVKFALYTSQSGGDPLWSETQSITLDASGKYSALLGSVATLPDSVFAQGQARWIGVTLSDEQESARTVLVATPYSFKASDAETLGGHPASDFTLKNALPATGTDITQINVGSGITGGGTGPTVTLGISNSYLESLGNEVYSQLSGNNILTGTNAFAAGKVTIGGSPALSVTSISAASPITANASGSTVKIGLSDSALLTLGNGVYAQLAAANTFSASNTFSKAVTFASGQTFPGTVSLSANNTFSGSDTFSKAVTFASGQTFSGAASLSANNNFSGANTISISTVGVPALLAENNGAAGSSEIGTTGVAGMGTTTGLFGNGGLYGVFGETATTTQGSAAMYGYAGGAGLATGVYGVSGSPSQTGAGLVTTFGGPGVFADSSDNPGYDGVALIAAADDSIGALVANNSSVGNYTLFVSSGNGSSDPFIVTNRESRTECFIDADADLYCDGTLTSGSATTANRVDDRRIASYAMQSAENWMEDAGSGQLSAGHTHIDLEQRFSQVVNAALEYHVFLTPEGDCKGLYIANKSASGFDVRELGGGKSGIAFSYRIMARRKGFESARLEDITTQMLKNQKAFQKMPAKATRPAAPLHRTSRLNLPVASGGIFGN